MGIKQHRKFSSNLFVGCNANENSFETLWTSGLEDLVVPYFMRSF